MFCRGEGQPGWGARPALALRGYLPPPGKGPTLALSFLASPAPSPVPGAQELCPTSYERLGAQQGKFEDLAWLKPKTERGAYSRSGAGFECQLIK